MPDLHHFLDAGRALPERDAPARTMALARSLREALVAAAGEAGPTVDVDERIVTDAHLRREADRDQNVYLGPLFTRVLTRALPDLVFQPATPAEAAAALRWARAQRVPVALRGAGSTAMGGAVPGDGGLVLDLTRLDGVELDAADGVCVAGAGARLRAVHRALAAHELALPVYPSNLGGTLAGWFMTGGIGMNAFGRGRIGDWVRAADLLLPSGEHVRFHDDGRLDVPDGHGRKTLAPPERDAWFRERGSPPLTLADLAGSEGIFGALLSLTVRVEERPVIGAFLLAFRDMAGALAGMRWIAAGGRVPRPANLKLVTGDHLHHTRQVWAEEDAKPWHERPGRLATAVDLPWRRILGPAGLGVDLAPPDAHPGALLFVDFLDIADARTFGALLGSMPGRPVAFDAESERFAADRFRPQQIKRLGPGLLAAEIVLPIDQLASFLERAEKLVAGTGKHFDPEVYALSDGTTLVIAGYFTDHRRGDLTLDLALSPALTDLAMREHGGRPYVIGRWQAGFARRADGATRARHLGALKRALDPQEIVNRGVRLGFAMRGPLGAAFAMAFTPGIALARATLGVPAIARPLRALLRLTPGPAAGRGAPAPTARVEDRALHCVNCGECNSVCPIFHESGIRLPQMLTHAGEALRGGEAMPRQVGVLLDLCMRCGNCEEVCQAGIPHLPIYERMQIAANAAGLADAGRHKAILGEVRGSAAYTRQFLDIRPGGYVKRAPASLPDATRYLVLRAESDAGPAATCIHCGGCVPVCPTSANLEFQDGDLRRITTDQKRCIGCGTCVEVCPANHANGGQTLRVVEAPTAAWFAVEEEWERSSGDRVGVEV